MKGIGMNGRIYAHSTPEPDKRNWQTLAEHSLAVGRLAGVFAESFNATLLAQVAGYLHDLGKYSAEFQARLSGGQAVDHSTWGAKFAIERFGPIGALLAYGIAGHHAGLANGSGEGERTPLYQRISSPLPMLLPEWEQEIELPERLATPASFKPHSKERGNFQLAFLTRMIFSCLVDADFLDTEAFYQKVGQSDTQPVRQRPVPDLVTLREQAGSDKKLCSLTVSTSGGKTLASLAFALDHAITHGLRCVIFVIPLPSVVEQNASVFRHALGDLGEYASFLAH